MIKQHNAQQSLEISCLQHFYNVRDRLSVAQGLVTYTYEQGTTRVVIPVPLRHSLIQLTRWPPRARLHAQEG